MDRKKIIIISSIIAGLVLIIGGIFFFASKKSGTTGDGGGFLGLFPDAGERGLEQGGEKGEGPAEEGGEGMEYKLFHLTNNAIAGATATSTANGSYIRYIERATGHIYEISPQGENGNRLSNTTILKSFESFWSPQADKMVINYFGDNGISNYYSARLATSTGAISGVFLPQDTAAVAVSPLEEKIFYLKWAEKGAVGVSADFENKKQQNVFNLPFGWFNASWPSANIISLLTRPSAKAEGFLYFFDLKAKKLEKMIGGMNGLTALASPNGEKIIYSFSANKGIQTNVASKEDKTADSFALTTFPEKCVWSKASGNIVYCAAPNGLPEADYPDEWYQGIISFNDSIWMMDLSTKEAYVLKTDSGADVINPFLTPDENYLVFTNKKDLTLWSLELR